MRKETACFMRHLCHIFKDSQTFCAGDISTNQVTVLWIKYILVFAATTCSTFKLIFVIFFIENPDFKIRIADFYF